MIAPQLPSRVSAAVDEVCDRFEVALLRGERPRIEEYLSQAVECRDWVLPELVALSLDYRLRAGEPATAAEYFVRFTSLASNGEVALWLVSLEFRALEGRGLKPNEADFRRRYADLANLPQWQAGPWAVSEQVSTCGAALDSNTTREVRVQKVDSTEFLKSILAPPEREGDLGRLGEYHIRGLLGAGGMGFVLSAEDPALRRSVAIKLMRPEVAATSDARERFLREARAAAAVEHPRVVIIHRVGEWNGAPYLVMPLMAGTSLGRRIKEGPPISPCEAARLVREAADGLAAAHAKGLIHRDIKPDNIWLEETAEGTHVRLLDFGLARSNDPELLTKTGVVLGTPNYMAPEQAGGGPVDGRCDLFSLGCVLYQLLTGQMAFAGPSLMSVLGALANHHPPSPRNLSPNVPESLSNLTMLLLDKSPDRRPESAEDVSTQLKLIEKSFDGLASTTRFEPARQVDKPDQTPAKLPLLAIAGMALVSLALLAGLIAWASTRDWNTTVKTNSPPPDSKPERAKPPDGGPAIDAPAPAVEPPALSVESINVAHFASTPEGDVPRGLLGHQSYSTYLGDRVQVTAKLSKPAYAYLIACRPDGVADLCFPADEETLPPKTDEPKYPQTSGLKAYGLREGTGLWVFAVVASDEPLPAYREWLANRPNGASFWQPVKKVTSGLVWWDDGLTNVHISTAGGVTAQRLRGKDETLDVPAEHIKRLTDALRAGDRREVTSAFGFSVIPRD